MKQAIVTVGAPASGKSTWARQKASGDEGKFFILERDQCRREILGLSPSEEINWKLWDWKREPEVTELYKAKLAGLMGRNCNLILSDTHLHEGRREELVRLLKKNWYEVTVLPFPIDEAEAIRRDSKRKYPVGASVIADMCNRFDAQFPLEKVTQNPALTPAYVFDIDGTLAIKGDRDVYDYTKVRLDTPREGVLNTLLALQHFYPLIAVSGRDDSCKDVTLEWLGRLGLAPRVLHMRKMGDNRDDVIIKKEIFLGEILPKYYTMAVFDDRPKVVRSWRRMGLEVFAVGNQLVEF